jgi:hypothetical protein
MHFPCHSPKNLFFFLSPYVATLYNILILRRGCAEVRHFATGDAFCYSILLHHLWGRRKCLNHKELRRAGRADFAVSPYGTMVCVEFLEDRTIPPYAVQYAAYAVQIYTPAHMLYKHSRITMMSNKAVKCIVYLIRHIKHSPRSRSQPCRYTWTDSPQYHR